MKTSIPARPHGVGLRGGSLSRNSPLFEGPFGRIFRALPPADFGNTDQQSEDALNALALSMIADPDDPKDGPDPEESGIPSIYTYFGQFIDHDLTFDPASSLQKQNDPDALEDFRTPRFDLDNVYGRGPDDQPYFYADGRTFLQGKPLSGAAANPNARDLPRSWDQDPLARDLSQRDRLKRRAIIGDPRNDENVIVSQLQGIFHRFHNKVSADHPDWPFARVQREVRFHYQWVVLNDFLPTIVAEEVLNLVVPHVVKGTDVRSDRPVLEFFKWKNGAFMPLEFSVAAYRFGHSMVRPGYRLSETVPPLAIFATNPNIALTGFREFPDNWAIDWNLFTILEPRDPDDATRTQLAYKIDTSLVNPLGNLPPSVAVNPNILALRNLLRGWRLRLPSGQDVARAMGIVPLKDAEIKIGKFTGDPADKLIPIVEVNPVFAGNCPLWTYILAETLETYVVVKTTKGDKTIKTRQLGHVGGRIVAETFVGLLLGDSSSYLSQDPLWTPDPKYQNAGCFGITELIRTALSRSSSEGTNMGY
jgi:Animal haem peroxidase